MASRLVQLLIRRPVRILVIWGGALVLFFSLNLDFHPVPGVRGLVPDGDAPEAETVSRLKRTFLEADRILVVLGA